MSKTRPVTLTSDQVNILKAMTDRQMMVVNKNAEKDPESINDPEAVRAITYGKLIDGLVDQMGASDQIAQVTHTFSRKQIRFLTKYLLMILTHIMTKTLPEYEKRFDKTGEQQYKDKVTELTERKMVFKELIEVLEDGL